MNKKSLIDNWSLQHAAKLLDESTDIEELSPSEFAHFVGGLSNFINALLLYSDVEFPLNGFENHWRRYEWFTKNADSFIKPLDVSSLPIDWHNEASYRDNGINNYLLTSKRFESDLFVSPERSTIIAKSEPNTEFLSNSLHSLLRDIDSKILLMNDTSWMRTVKVGVERNFVLPSITHYVLKESSSREDLLTVIMQLKTSGKIDAVHRKIREVIYSDSGGTKFQKEVERIISKEFGNESASKNTWSLSVNALFLTLRKTFNLNFYNRKEHIVFLKDIVKCRTEVNGLYNDLERVFNRKKNYPQHHV